jgi:hypothetical protein
LREYEAKLEAERNAERDTTRNVQCDPARSGSLNGNVAEPRQSNNFNQSSPSPRLPGATSYINGRSG